MIITLLFIKHFIVDFCLQTPYQYLNKGKYLHLGGIVHALLHGIATAIIVPMSHSLLLGLLDFVIHYHIDYCKVKINQKYDLKPNKDERFWILLGFDQLMHALTYIWLASLL